MALLNRRIHSPFAVDASQGFYTTKRRSARRAHGPGALDERALKELGVGGEH